MAEHTPGPWRSDSPYVSAPSGEHRKIMANCDQYFSDDECEYLSDDECEANIQLIAAAPATSSIEWTDRTWNPVRGCSVVSPGCVNCYAMKQAHRFSGKGKAYEGLTKLTSAGPQWTGKIRLVEEALTEPRRWRKPSRVFVNSMSDLFHEDVPDAFIDQVFAVMACCPTHTFQVLTKRPGRMLKYLSYEYRWAQVEGQCDVLVGGSEAPALATPERTHLPNVWLGVSVEDQARADERIPLLLQTPAAVRFVSCEPLLDALNVRHYIGLDGANSGADFRERNGWGYDEWSGGFTGPNLHNDSCYAPEPGIHWVIVGGESGSGARRCDLRWVRDLVRDCRSAHVPVFVKQLGARPDGWWPTFPLNRHAVRDPKGGNIAEWPEDLRVREYPEMAGAIANDGQG